jgi:epsilon-lactone hydrolase
MEQMVTDSSLRAIYEANRKPGPRAVPAKVLPIPRDVDPEMAEAIAAPYDDFDALEGLDADGWRAAAQKLSEILLPQVVQLREALGVSVEQAIIGGVNAYIVTPKDIPERHRNKLVIHFHGGGFLLGAGEVGASGAILFAAYGGYKVISVDYRMPPDHPFPAAVDDALAVYRVVIAGTDPRCIAVEGGSAGGNILLSLMLRIKQEGLPMPAAIAPNTPEADLTWNGDSFHTNEWADNVLVTPTRGYLDGGAKLYAAGHDLTDPFISPAYGDFHGFPPGIMVTGTRDLLLSPTIMVHRKLRRAGIDAELHVYEGQSHSQYLFAPRSETTREIYGDIARFFDKYLKS